MASDGALPLLGVDAAAQWLSGKGPVASKWARNAAMISPSGRSRQKIRMSGAEAIAASA
jgi:hypothetical protein